MTEDHLSRLARMEVHLQHILKIIEAERGARIALRAEVIRMHETLRRDLNEQRADREAMIRRVGAWVIQGLALLVGVLASSALGIDFPSPGW